MALITKQSKEHESNCHLHAWHQPFGRLWLLRPDGDYSSVRGRVQSSEAMGKHVRIKGSLACDPHVTWTLLFRVPAVLSFVHFTRQGHVCLCVCVCTGSW